ncbi:MAG: hypothetical protein AMXMBFR33_22960 [Candidatus Xenobia bacterium]|jgi:uncharacterized membrane protein YhaH (DUF805 family)
MEDGNGGGIVGVLFGLIMLAVVVVCIAGMWKLFEKAGKPGWACIIPFYSAWVLMEIIGFPGYYMLIMFIPFVGALFSLYCMFKLPQVFGKDAMWGILCVLFAPIVMLMLGFGDAQYTGAA